MVQFEDALPFRMSLDSTRGLTPALSVQAKFAVSLLLEHQDWKGLNSLAAKEKRDVLNLLMPYQHNYVRRAR